MPGGAATGLAQRRVAVLLAVLLAQAVVGIVQAITGVPGGLVVVHLLGAALVWVGVLRVLLDTHPALFGRVIPVRDVPVDEPVGRRRAVDPVRTPLAEARGSRIVARPEAWRTGSGGSTAAPPTDPGGATDTGPCPGRRA